MILKVAFYFVSGLYGGQNDASANLSSVLALILGHLRPLTKLFVCYSTVRSSRETSDRRRLEDGRRMQGVRRQRASGYVQQFNDESSSIIICVVALPPIPFSGLNISWFYGLICTYAQIAL